MGDEVRCTARLGDETSEGRALLESDALLFRGAFRLHVPFREVRAVEAREGVLAVTFAGGTASFDLGPRAERWAERIRNPRSLLDKLGVKPDSRVTVLGVEDEDFRRLLAERVGEFSESEPRPNSDVVFLGAREEADLARLGRLTPFLRSNGAVWVVAPKGGARPTEAKVLAAGREAELVDTKVVRFSDTHTAHKFVVPVARR